jgi:hypothetical protein
LPIVIARPAFFAQAAFKLASWETAAAISFSAIGMLRLSLPNRRSLPKQRSLLPQSQSSLAKDCFANFAGREV